MNLLDDKPSNLLPKYIADYKSLFDIDEDVALTYIKNNQHFEHLTNEWYENLAINDMEAAYSVYNDDYYFTDVWNCFIQYSRRYLKDINRPCFKDGSSFVEKTQNAKVILDVGCGIGYTTSILTQLYPNAKVFGTNLKNTKQWQFCEMMSSRYGFHMVESAADIGNNVDVVFASEYFEHFYEPIEHLATIINDVSPEYFVIGNAFNTWSIGHFIKYKAFNKIIDQSKIGGKFNASLRRLGYKRLKTKLFNNKPNIWQKRNMMLSGDNCDKS
jgi:2-polyprenyl-3-methyl-5-hydroxy-6-metoxy-1,4-benzoquinol methylase